MSRETDRDTRPHSRACGWKNHPHGSECHPTCPTCHPPTKQFDPFLQVILDKGLEAGLNELKVVTEEDLANYFDNPYLSSEAFNVQQFTIKFGGRGHDFIRGLVFGMVSGILVDPNVLYRDVRGALAILANDGVDIITGEQTEGLMMKPEDENGD